MPHEKNPVIASGDFVEVLSVPCDICGERATYDEKTHFPPYTVAVRRKSGKKFSEAKYNLCEDCFDSICMEWERLKNGG